MKRYISAILLIVALITVTAVTYKSLEGIKDLDLNDPFEVDFDE